MFLGKRRWGPPCISDQNSHICWNRDLTSATYCIFQSACIAHLRKRCKRDVWCMAYSDCSLSFIQLLCCWDSIIDSHMSLHTKRDKTFSGIRKRCLCVCVFFGAIVLFQMQFRRLSKHLRGNVIVYHFSIMYSHLASMTRSSGIIEESRYFFSQVQYFIVCCMGFICPHAHGSAGKLIPASHTPTPAANWNRNNFTHIFLFFLFDRQRWRRRCQHSRLEKRRCALCSFVSP